MKPALITFSVLNMILAALSLASGIYLLLLVVSSTIAPDASVYGSLGPAVTGFSSILYLLATAGYGVAAAGILKKTAWGYYTHLVMAGLTAFNPSCCCLGIAYAVPAFVICLQSDFREPFGLNNRISHP